MSKLNLFKLILITTLFLITSCGEMANIEKSSDKNSLLNNHKPIISDLTFYGQVNQTLENKLTAIDADKGILNFKLVSDAKHGNLELKSDGSFTYEPDNNFKGSDKFTFTASNKLATSNIGTATINIGENNNNSGFSVPIVVHIIATDEGTAPVGNNIGTIIESDLNKNFDDSGEILIKYKLDQVKNHRDSEFYNLIISQGSNNKDSCDILIEKYAELGKVNIFIVNSISDDKVGFSYTNQPLTPDNFWTSLAIEGYRYASDVVTHEIGHTVGLKHTYQPYADSSGSVPSIYNYPGVGSIENTCEPVSYNLVDTPAAQKNFMYWKKVFQNTFFNDPYEQPFKTIMRCWNKYAMENN